MRSKAFALLAVSALAGCKGKAAIIDKVAPGPDSPEAAARPKSADAPQTSLDEEAAARVTAAFPTGPATEHFVQHVKFDPEPPAPTVDPGKAWVIEIPFQKPMNDEDIASALGAAPETSTLITYYERNGASPWINALTEDAPGTFDRLAVEVPLLDSGDVLTKEDADKVLAWVGEALPKLHGNLPVHSMRPEAAVARAKVVHDALDKIDDDDATIRVEIARPDGTPIPTKLAWDALYSSGFTFDGAGGLEWKPYEGAHRVVSYTRDMGSWSPEEATKPGATAESIVIVLDVMRSTQVHAVINATLEQADYIAKRVGGRVLDAKTQEPLNITAAHEFVTATALRLKEVGVTPGSPLTNDL